MNNIFSVVLEIAFLIVNICFFFYFQEKTDDLFSPEDDSATTTPKTVVSNTQSPLPHISPTPSISSDVSTSERGDRPTTPRPRAFSKGVRVVALQIFAFFLHFHFLGHFLKVFHWSSNWICSWTSQKNNIIVFYFFTGGGTINSFIWLYIIVVYLTLPNPDPIN